MTLTPPVVLAFFFIQLFTISGSSGFGLIVVNNDSVSGTPYWTNKFEDALAFWITIAHTLHIDEERASDERE